MCDLIRAVSASGEDMLELVSISLSAGYPLLCFMSQMLLIIQLPICSPEFSFLQLQSYMQSLVC